MIALGVGIVIGLLAGLLIGFALWHKDDRPSMEQVRAAVVQADGSVVVARVPNAKPPKAPHIIPPGNKEERRVSLIVMPEPTVTATGEVCTCDPVEVNLSLIKGDDGSGIVASADGGTVDARGSVDIPILDSAPVQYRHFALLTAEPGAGNYSGLIGKRFLGNRLGVGVGASKTEGRTPGPLVGVEFNW